MAKASSWTAKAGDFATRQLEEGWQSARHKAKLGSPHRQRATSPRCPSPFHFSLRFHSEEEKPKVAWEAKFPRVRVRAAHPVLRSESPPKMLPLCCKAEDGREEKVNEPQAEKV